MSFDHILSCGHTITTPTPNEPCAPNCHHIATAAADTNNQTDQAKAIEKNKQDDADVSNLPFYCDACVESEFEALIPDDMSATAAETLRATLRASHARKHEKHHRFRMCYIGLKITTLPCDSDGNVRSGYVPRSTHHVFDTVVPQVGDNFFEGVEEEDGDGDGNDGGELGRSWRKKRRRRRNL
jgi:hypothetical protein